MPLDATGAPPLDELDPYSAQVVHAFDRVGPAVVHVIALDADGSRRGQGSGVIFTPDGYVLTNAHVVAGAARLRASLTDGQALEATLVGDDPATDTAVLRLAADGLPHAELGQSAGAAGGPAGGGDRQSAGLHLHRHRRDRQRARPHAAHAVGASDGQRDPDRRTAEPGQFRRAAGGGRRRAQRGGHQHRDDRSGAGHLLRHRHRHRGLGCDAADARRARAARRGWGCPGRPCRSMRGCAGGPRADAGNRRCW